MQKHSIIIATILFVVLFGVMNANGNVLPLPCPNNYMFSCQPSLQPVPCEQPAGVGQSAITALPAVTTLRLPTVVQQPQHVQYNQNVKELQQAQYLEFQQLLDQLLQAPMLTTLYQENEKHLQQLQQQLQALAQSVLTQALQPKTPAAVQPRPHSQASSSPCRMPVAYSNESPVYVHSPNSDDKQNSSE